MERTKYPRTMNMPHSGSNSSDDVWWEDCARFEGKEVVVSEKLDGECTTIYPDGHVHARSIDTSHHASRSWIKALAGSIAHEIPDNFRICGENLFAWHSIFYTELPSYFFVFGIYDGDRCLSWDETEDICDILGLHTVPVFYRGIWDEEGIESFWSTQRFYRVGAFPTFDDPDQKSPCIPEGYVVRLADEFLYKDFSQCCAKYVRAAHVKTDQNWMSKKVTPNLLK